MGNQYSHIQELQISAERTPASKFLMTLHIAFSIARYIAISSTKHYQMKS